MALRGINEILTHKPVFKKVLAVGAIAAVYSLLNHYFRIGLPGITHVDIRPQIVLLLIAGYLYGPAYGFLAGFAGNLCSDFLIGFDWRYLPSWTIGNGLMGGLIGFFPYRKRVRLDRISQLVFLVLFLILVNILSLAYAAGMENILDRELITADNFRYFYLPALMSNVLSVLILFPAILFGLGRLQKNYPVKLALANYYLAVFLLFVSALAFVPADRVLPLLLMRGAASETSVAHGNMLVLAFNNWSLLVVGVLIFSFLISSLMSKAVVTPLKQLEETVLSVLRGDPASADRLARFVKRDDEIGILSYTIRLLGEKLWETQQLSRHELEKQMAFLDARDSGSDILTTALFSLFGRDACGDDGGSMEALSKREISNIDAVSLVVAACGLTELAATYSDEKINRSFEDVDPGGPAAALSKEQHQALALAVDVNLLFKGRLKMMNFREPLGRELAFHLLERARDFRRSDKNYIGYVTEPDIVGRVCDRWEKTKAIRSETLEPVMNKAILNRIVVGYQIKRPGDLARFDVNLKIAYSHSDIKHVKQLIGLLASESLQAKIQLEPKRSSFHYLPEWEKREGLELEYPATGTAVAHKNEFDIVFEFASQDHRDRFRAIIQAYAQRESGTNRKLLHASWYQPLFRSDVPVAGYQRVADIIVNDGTFVVQAYVTEEKVNESVSWFLKEMPHMEITTSPVWVNDAFFLYLSENCG